MSMYIVGLYYDIIFCDFSSINISEGLKDKLIKDNGREFMLSFLTMTIVVTFCRSIVGL